MLTMGTAVIAVDSLVEGKDNGIHWVWVVVTQAACHSHLTILWFWQH